MTGYQTIEINGTEVFYRESGSEDAPALLLLHGFPSSSAQYDSLVRRLAGSHHVVAPDYPGFGRSPALTRPTTFDRLAEVIEAFTEARQLGRFGVYMFDFGSPVGFRIATNHPERIQALVIQNGNAYEVGLGAPMRALQPYWDDRQANESAIRGFLTLEATRSQYVDGVPDTTSVNPDLWQLDQSYIEMPGRDQVMLDLLYDYRNNVRSYPAWQQYLRDRRPPTLLAWGSNDAFFPPEGAHAYLDDLPDAELHFLDTGHFATATHSAEIADLIVDFFRRRVGTAETN
jgi:pimeloyl-ACP methyl ester carboxylesterase